MLESIINSGAEGALTESPLYRYKVRPSLMAKGGIEAGTQTDYNSTIAPEKIATTNIKESVPCQYSSTFTQTEATEKKDRETQVAKIATIEEGLQTETNRFIADHEAQTEHKQWEDCAIQTQKQAGSEQEIQTDERYPYSSSSNGSEEIRIKESPNKEIMAKESAFSPLKNFPLPIESKSVASAELDVKIDEQFNTNPKEIFFYYVISLLISL